MRRVLPTIAKLTAVLILFLQFQPRACAWGVEPKKAVSGDIYSVFPQDGLLVDWTLTRPDPSDSAILLCVPAAFTDTFATLKSVHGLAIEHGKFVKRNADGAIGGALEIVDGRCTVLALPKGTLTGEQEKHLEETNGSLFQQFQVVRDGSAEKFKDKSQFQRRGFCIFKDGQAGIIESRDAITLTQFGEDGVSLGANNLIYFDMGPWDEGWYRNPETGKLMSLGKDRSMTAQQTNWFVFKKPVLKRGSH